MSSLGDVSEDEASQDADQNDRNPQSPFLDHGNVQRANDDDDNYASSDEDVREGRFHGPDSSWRFYTQEERALAASLDQIECNDLSIHLYNVHAWKSQYRRDPPDEDIKTWRSKQDWIEPNADATLPFLPKPDWTAWPLSPMDVPRSFERWGVVPVSPEEESSMYRRSEPWKPGRDLRDELRATFLRTAKERFNSRLWGPDSSALNVDKFIDVKTGVSSEASRRTSTSSQQSAHNESIKVEAHDDDVPKPAMTTLSSSSNDAYEALFIADDDEAGMLLQPTLHHAMAKLDDLLIGLHKSRQGHSRRSSSSHSRPRRLKSRSRSRPASSASVHQKRKWQSFDDADADKLHDAEARSDADDGSPTASIPESSHRSYVRRLGTRDWSEVLGVAALAGWDHTVLERAAQRCAAIFNETMSLRLMPEAPVGQQRDHIEEFMPAISQLVAAASDEDGEQSDETSDSPDFLCPFETCERHAVPFEYRWRLTEHLKRKHGQTNESLQLAAAIKGQETDEEVVDVSGEGEPEEDGDGHSEEESEPGAIREDGFLQPFNVSIGRSRDIRARSRQPRHSTEAEKAS